LDWPKARAPCGIGRRQARPDLNRSQHQKYSDFRRKTRKKLKGTSKNLPVFSGQGDEEVEALFLFYDFT